MKYHMVKSYWSHPGGKLRDEGPQSLSDSELLSILIGSGISGCSAEKIALEIVSRFGSLTGLLNQPLTKLLEIKGLGDVRVIAVRLIPV
jgi:DNA repair protein RadC